MFKFGNASRKKLNTVWPSLAGVFEEALDLGLIDIAVIQGARSKAEQDEYFRTGKSKVQWPNSKHNVRGIGELSRAVDAAPFVNGNVSWNKDHCIFLAGIVLAISKKQGVRIRWGGNWDMDAEPITDQDFQDLVHFEVVEA